MKKNIKLLFAIISKDLKQRDFAGMVGDHFTTVSKVINGRLNLDKDHQKRYADALGLNVGDIFED